MSQETKKTIYLFIGTIALVLLVRLFIFTPVIIMGDSMDPTLEDGERVIATLHSKIDRFDIVTFPAPDEKGRNYVKRVIGLPGDSVRYEDDKLYVNDKEVDEPYLDKSKEAITDGQPLTGDFYLEKVPQGELFVLGDNRRVSKDSRYIGTIKIKDIEAEPKFCFWPPSKIGFVK